MKDLSVDIHAAKEEYNILGYSRINGVFDKEELAQVKEVAYTCIDQLEDKNQLQRKNGRPALLFWPQNISDYIKNLTRDPRMLAIVNEFLGPDTRQLNNQIYYRESGDGDEFGWHQDVCFRTPPEDFSNIEEGYLQTIIAIDDIGPQNGAVEFIQGSHKYGLVDGLVPRDNSERGLRKFVRGDWKGEKLTAQAGDVLIWSVMAVHGSEQNNSLNSRMTFMNGFCREDALLNKSRFPVFTKDGRPV